MSTLVALVGTSSDNSPLVETAHELLDLGVPSWAIALLIWSSAMVLLAVATFRAGQILLRVMPDRVEQDDDDE